MNVNNIFYAVYIAVGLYRMTNVLYAAMNIPSTAGRSAISSPLARNPVSLTFTPARRHCGWPMPR